MPLSSVERGRVGAAHSCSSGRSSRRCAGALSSPSRCGWRLLHRRERPAVSGELARDGDHDDRAGLASGLERVPACVQPAGARGRLGLARRAACRARRRSSVTLSAERAALVPGGLDQQPAGVRVAGLGDRALAAPLAARVLARGEAEERAERLGPEPVPVAELDRQRERRQRRDAAETDEPLDDIDVRLARGELGDRLVERVPPGLRVAASRP